MTDKISVLNTETGQVSKYPSRLFGNKRLFPDDVFTQVEDGQKSYVPELYQGRSVEEYEAAHPDVSQDEADDEVVDEINPEEEE